jgi:hypothetical protein
MFISNITIHDVSKISIQKTDELPSGNLTSGIEIESIDEHGNKAFVYISLFSKDRDSLKVK